MEEPDIRSWPGLSCQFGANCSCARRKDTERQAVHGTVANRTKSKVTVNKPEERAAWQRHGVRTTGASVRARAAAKPRSARATARPVSKSAVKPHKRHRLLGFLATMFALLALAGAAARALPADLQELPFAPIVVSATPWFTLLGLIALLLAIVSRRILAALIAIAAIACNGYWQYPFFYSTDPLPQAAQNAVAAASPNTSDACARVMTFNVYKGQADPQAIVELVRDQRVEVLALQETTEDFVKKLNEAGIEHYLPYAQVSSSDGVFGNGLWSATPLADPTDDDVNSSASFMPGGTVDMVASRFDSYPCTPPLPYPATGGSGSDRWMSWV